MAMKCMVDFLMAFRMEDRSSEGENPEENGNDSTTPSGKALILSLLLDNLLHSDSEMRTVAAEGLARLLFCARIEAEPEILSKLLLLFFNPATEDDDLHRQSMSVFFPAFAARSQTNRSLFEEALILTLNAISSAPSVSPIASVDPVEMSLYTFYLLEVCSGIVASLNILLRVPTSFLSLTLAPTLAQRPTAEANRRFGDLK
mmetsp:Transcript_4786/g.20538  ORF Transcript_4786/g.20538 Transcript_4786/m.20538 type:complete len:202 (+) Transcript_4786:2157-2762(+)